MAKEIWFFAENNGGKIKKVTLELLSVGRIIANENGEKLAAVLFGKDMAKLVDNLGEYGVDKVYLADNDELAKYTTEDYSKVLVDLIEKYDPTVVLMGYTIQGRNLAVRVAQKVGARLISDCTSIELENGGFIFLRPLYSGKAFVKVACPVVAIVRPNMLTAELPKTVRKAEVAKVKVNLGEADLQQKIKDVAM